MDLRSVFFEDSSLIPYVSFVINRPNFTRWKVKERTIEDHELVLIAGGEGVLRSGKKCLPVKKGTLLYLYSGFWHSLEANSNTTINFYSVHFAYALAQHSVESWSYHEDINYYLKNEKESGQNWTFDVNTKLLPFKNTMEVTNYSKVEDIFIQLNKTYLEKEVGYRLKLNILCQELIYELLKECYFPPDKKVNIRRLEIVFQYISKHYRERILLKDMCNLINVSESSLIRLFNNNIGKTPVEYINQFRLNKAKELLLHTADTIKEIAYNTGFEDEFYFSRIFKKMEGKSPKKYRKLMLS
jgi:AraC-like DNA-binding protein